MKMQDQADKIRLLEEQVKILTNNQNINNGGSTGAMSLQPVASGVVQTNLQSSSKDLKQKYATQGQTAP